MAILRSLAQFTWFTALTVLYFTNTFDYTSKSYRSILEISFLHLFIYVSYLIYTIGHLVMLVSKYCMTMWFFEEVYANGLSLFSSCLAVPVLLDTPYQTVCRLIKLYTDGYPFHMVTAEMAHSIFPYMAAVILATIIIMNDVMVENAATKQKQTTQEPDYKYVANNKRTTNSRYNLRKSRSASNP